MPIQSALDGLSLLNRHDPCTSLVAHRRAGDGCRAGSPARAVSSTVIRYRGTVTTDVYQTTEGTANAYTIRAKYAYFQYDAHRPTGGSRLMGRVGIQQNVAIERSTTAAPTLSSSARRKWQNAY